MTEYNRIRLGDLCLIKGQYGINAAAVEYSPDLPAYLRITDLGDNNQLDLSKRKSVRDDDSDKFLLRHNEIVFARTGGTVGKTYLHSEEKNGIYVFAGFLIKFKTNPELLNPKYLKLYTESSEYWNWVKIMSVRSGQPGINGKEYSSLKIPLPPIFEQKKIADILSTWDKAIETTQSLLDKLQLRKKGLMQKLLTGKKRLPGFKGKWEEMRMEDLTQNFSKRNKELIEARVYSVTNDRGFILQTDMFSHEVAGKDLKGYKIIKEKEFAYNPARINVGSIAHFKDEIGIISSLYVCFKTNENLLDEYLEYILKTHEFQYKIQRYGEGGVRIYLWYYLFKHIKMKIPNVKEQAAINNILGKADEEINQTQKYLDRLQEQKKGLMQQLLTGQKRVKV